MLYLSELALAILVMISLLFAFLPQLAIQHSILNVSYDHGGKRYRDKQNNSGPADRIEWRITLLEKLTANDTGSVGGHDEDRHGYRTLSSALSV